MMSHQQPFRVIYDNLSLITSTLLTAEMILLETPNVPSTKSQVLFPLLRSCHRISPGPKRFETFRNNKKLLRCGGFCSHAQPPSWRTTPCQLSATSYSIHSQLPSVPGELPSIRNLRTRHAVVTRDPPNMDTD
jgi:hypothetical protein